MEATVRYMPGQSDPAVGLWQGRAFGAGQAITVRQASLLENLPKGFTVERSAEERAANQASLKGKQTSSDVASTAAKLMHHDDPDVRKVAASAVSQKAKR